MALGALSRYRVSEMCQRPRRARHGDLGRTLTHLAFVIRLKCGIEKPEEGRWNDNMYEMHDVSVLPPFSSLRSPRTPRTRHWRTSRQWHPARSALAGPAA